MDLGNICQLNLGDLLVTVIKLVRLIGQLKLSSQYELPLFFLIIPMLIGIKRKPTKPSF